MVLPGHSFLTQGHTDVCPGLPRAPAACCLPGARQAQTQSLHKHMCRPRLQTRTAVGSSLVVQTSFGHRCDLFKNDHGFKVCELRKGKLHEKPVSLRIEYLCQWKKTSVSYLEVRILTEETCSGGAAGTAPGERGHVRHRRTFHASKGKSLSESGPSGPVKVLPGGPHGDPPPQPRAVCGARSPGQSLGDHPPHCQRWGTAEIGPTGVLTTSSPNTHRASAPWEDCAGETAGKWRPHVGEPAAVGDCAQGGDGPALVSTAQDQGSSCLSLRGPAPPRCGLMTHEGLPVLPCALCASCDNTSLWLWAHPQSSMISSSDP